MIAFIGHRGAQGRFGGSAQQFRILSQAQYMFLIMVITQSQSKFTSLRTWGFKDDKI